MIFDLSDSTLQQGAGQIVRRPGATGALTLRELLQSLDTLNVQGDLDVPVTGLCIDSRKVVPGSLFFALSGQLTDGNYFAREAVSRGACAIISSAPPMEEESTWVQVPSARSTLAWVARRFYGYPDTSMRVIGVTGTNGKTSVTTLAQHLIRNPDEGEKTALLGTIHNDLGGKIVPAKRTTAEAHELFEYLAKSKDGGCTRAIMEVSSHGVSQKRVLGLEFQTAVFMNLTPEHLDFHHSMEHYFQAKKTFVGGGEGNQPPKHAVLNIDDAYGKRLYSELPSSIRKITFGEDMWADFRASQFKLSAGKTEFLLTYPGCSVQVSSPLLGHFNVQNLMAALAAGWIEGFRVEDMLERLQSFPGVPGRLERVQAGQDFNVIVDYAHTDDALENILSVLREVTVGRLLLVFGCGGDRDQDKRPAMTRTAQKYCDYVWATADNPRSEPLSSIFKQMEAGVRDPSKIKFVKERRRAIGLAISSADEPGDCVVIAGKGHETYQEYGSTVIPFDDRRVAEDLLKLRFSSPGS